MRTKLSSKSPGPRDPCGNCRVKSEGTRTGLSWQDPGDALWPAVVERGPDSEAGSRSAKRTRRINTAFGRSLPWTEMSRGCLPFVWFR